MRILLYPRPTQKYSVGIVQALLFQDFCRRGYKMSNPLLFQYAGISIPAWDHAFVFGKPRFFRRVLDQHKSLTLTMGLPEHRDLYDAMNLEYKVEHAQQREIMFSAMSSVGKVVFPSFFARDVWANLISDDRLPFDIESQSTVIYHPVDTKVFVPTETPSSEPFTIGCFGALRRKGRVSTLFEASRRLPFKHRLLLVGSLSHEARYEFERGMESPQIAAITEYVPWVDHDALPRLLGKCHCLLHAMHAESFCLVTAEAMACGIPVIVPEYGAPAEYIGLGGEIIRGSRWVWDDDEYDQVCQAIVKIRESICIYSKEARDTALRLFDAEKVGAQYLNVAGLPSQIV